MRLRALLITAALSACTVESPVSLQPGADGGPADVMDLDAGMGTDVAPTSDTATADVPTTTESAVLTPDAPCVDNDNDGYPATECGGMAPDCDDNSSMRNPGRTEVCDGMGVDEDCNPCTVAGASDGDGDRDTFLGAGCFNRYAGTAPSSCGPAVRIDGAMLRVIGRDCDDTNNNVRPDQTESPCNNVDDNCNGMVDEGAQRTFYRDGDGDGFGDPSAPPRMACTPPTGYVENNTDCDDSPMTGAGVNPSGREVCDDAMRDENCNGARNEGCTCVEGRRYPCAEQRGRCAGSEQLCVGNMLGMCSYSPQQEVCDSADNDCDGQTDEPASMSDPGGIMPRRCSTVTPAMSTPGLRREVFSNPRLEGRPSATAVDTQINVNWSTSSPAGAPADDFSVRWSGMLQPPTDGTYTFDVSNCDDGGRLWLDERLVVDQWHFGGTRRGPPIQLSASRRYALRFEMREDGGGASAVLAWQRPGATAFETVPGTAFAQPFVGIHGSCREGMTACQGGIEVCTGAQGPQTETCDGVDNDCDGEVDENDLRPWCNDTDGDRRASMVASACVSRCGAPSGTFAGAPYEDCDDANRNRYPGNPDVACDQVDQDCTGSDNTSCPVSGQSCQGVVCGCPAGTMLCSSGCLQSGSCTANNGCGGTRTCNGCVSTLVECPREAAFSRNGSQCTRSEPGRSPFSWSQGDSRDNFEITRWALPNYSGGRGSIRVSIRFGQTGPSCSGNGSCGSVNESNNYIQCGSTQRLLYAQWFQVGTTITLDCAPGDAVVLFKSTNGQCCCSSCTRNATITSIDYSAPSCQSY